LDRLIGSACGYCNRVVDQGAYDWTVSSITVVERNARPPILTGTTEEEGTSLPTVFDPGLGAAVAALQQRDSAFHQDALFARINLLFQTMQTAWSSLAWESARPYLTDHLFQTNAYWIAAYRAQGLRNITQNARITYLEMVRLEADRWYDAVTVRVHATGLDYTLREADGTVVGGNRSRERAYTEYWTLVRSASRQGPAKAQPACPNCGAPMNVNMAAVCNHCNAKVNSGEFDWVLSRIEQDEVYGG
jgi:predicted lipid-binding transport protein (Tim44 family)